MSCCICNDDVITKDSIIKWKADKALICQMAASILNIYSDNKMSIFQRRELNDPLILSIKLAKEIARLVEEDDEI